MKKTEWFPADVKPVRPGWYERDWNFICKGTERLDWWSGTDWHYGGGLWTPVSYPAPANRKWRGLAEKPE